MLVYEPVRYETVEERRFSEDIGSYTAFGIRALDKEGNEINLLDIIEQQQTDIVDEMELGENIRKMFQYLKECLTERERTILYLRYGLGNGEEVTQCEIGDMLGISRSYVSRIETKALKKLRKVLRQQDF